MLDGTTMALVKEYHDTKSISVACELCDYLYKRTQEGEKDEEN